MANKTIGELDNLTPTSTSLFAMFENEGTGKASIQQVLNTTIPELVTTVGTSVKNAVNGLASTVNTMNGNLTSLETLMGENSITNVNNTVTGAIGNNTLTTTAQTLSGGINELNSNLNTLENNSKIIIKSYSYSKGYIGVGQEANISANDFNVETPNGYIPIAIGRATYNFQGMSIRGLFPSASGTQIILYGKNISSNSYNSLVATVEIIYIKSDQIIST